MSCLIAVTPLIASSIVPFTDQVMMHAQAHKAPSQDPSTYVRVSAPLAQSIMVKVKAHHDDIVKLGLHALPYGSTDNAIVANIAPEKIGKKSAMRCNN